MLLHTLYMCMCTCVCLQEKTDIIEFMVRVVRITSGIQLVGGAMVAMITRTEMAIQFKSRLCFWEDLSLTDTEKLQECGSNKESIHKVLREILGISSEDKQAMIELDLYTHAIIFAKKNDFSAGQTSTFFTILKSVHKLCISTPFDNQEQALELFNNLLVRHGVTRPPLSITLFSLKEVKTITEYVLSSYFKHYKLYKYAFTKKVRLNLRLAYEEEEVQEIGKEVTEEIEEVVVDSDIIKEPDTYMVESNQTAGEPSEENPTLEQTEAADHNDLEGIVTTTLTKKLKDLEVSIGQEMNSQEKNLSDRIAALEKLVGDKAKQKKR